MFWSIAEIAQTGFVVDDLDSEIDRWHAKGCGKFTVFNNLNVPLVSKGTEVTFNLSIALAQFNGVQIELIQPHDAQNSVFTDRFPDGWPSGDDGFHHIGLISNDFENSCEKLIADGYQKTMWGDFGGYRFAYFDTREKLGFYLEVFEGNEAMRALFDSIKNA